MVLKAEEQIRVESIDITLTKYWRSNEHLHNVSISAAPKYQEEYSYSPVSVQNSKL